MAKQCNIIHFSIKGYEDIVSGTSMKQTILKEQLCIDINAWLLARREYMHQICSALWEYILISQNETSLW